MEKVVFTENITPSGSLTVRVFKSGVLIEEAADDNLIVNIAKGQLAHLLAGETTGRTIVKIAFGTSNVEPLPTDSVITGQWSKAISGYSFPENGKVRFDWILNVTENNGMAIKEFGLLTGDGQLFARRVRTNPINKESDISVEGSWIISFN